MTSKSSHHKSQSAELRSLASWNSDLEKDVIDQTLPAFSLPGHSTSSMPFPSYQPFPFHFDTVAAYEKWLPYHRRMHKVSWSLKMQEQQSGPSVYQPIMVSLGPYHHGKNEFRETDEFKHLCLQWCVKGMDERKGYLYNTILSRIGLVRNCYAEVSIVDQYDDNCLALMMLLDASFIINFMNIPVDDIVAKNSYNCLGVAAALPFAARDIMLLENQIPFFVLKLMLSEICGAEQAQNSIEGFVSGLMSMKSERATIPGEYEDPPVHILEACRRVLVGTHSTTCPDQQYNWNNHIVQAQNNAAIADYQLSSTLPQPTISNEHCYASKENTSFPISCPSSITHLKSKGIQVRQSSSHSLSNIKFVQAQNNAAIADYQLSSTLPQPTISNENRYASKENTSFPISCPSSITHLKSKGIQVRQSSSHSLSDIKFVQAQNNAAIAGYPLSSTLPQPIISNENTRYASKENTSFRISCPSSITHLKSKGIQVRQSSSHSLSDIKFESHALYGQLQLPVCYVSNLTLIYLSNMIAYEVAPDNTIISPDLAVLSYTSFMKALIQTPADVLELQQKGVLRINRFANHEQVVKLFQGIDTFNLRNATIYQSVMLRIAEHCNSKAKTWMADLIHGKLNSPWAIIALLSATMLLILTFLQTYFTIHPVR